MENQNNHNMWKIVDKELLTLIKGRRGGKTTLEILDAILKGPYNSHQLSKKLKIDYNTVKFHLKIIYKHDYITREKFEETYFYYPTEKLYNNLKEYNLIKEIMKNEKNRDEKNEK